MSREVRRVPVGWSHPIEANPYWREQEASRLRRGRPESRLHGPTERFVPLHDRDILRYYEEGEELPEEDTLMPDFHAQELGWCLYESVSEGTPVTPVFATAEGLIDYLCAHGMDWDQEPFRREAAERLVRTGHSFASFFSTGGPLLDGSKDLDLVPPATKGSTQVHNSFIAPAEKGSE